MYKKIRFKRVLFLAIILIPFWLWLAWFLTPKRKFVAAIIDKTVLTSDGQEHISLTWVLKHQRFTKTLSKLYQIDDYFGFFPLDEQQYKLKGLERFNESQLEQLSQDSDLTFYTDTYGIYREEWFSGKSQTERSGILYGGMANQDVSFLKKMKSKHKLIMMEFNDINSPTSLAVRKNYETEFGIHWTGWIGRYFSSLDTTINEELPHWLVRNYRKKHHGEWPFTKSGIAFVNEKDEVVVLEKDTHLRTEVPFMSSTKFGQEYFKLPQYTKFPYWFDILENNPKVNRIVSYHNIDANIQGKKILARYHIPTQFPGIVMHKAADYEFYYFSGDFSDNPIGLTSAYFKGIEYVAPYMFTDADLSDRNEFFWEIYQPMTTRILEDYYQKINKKPND
ncbi:hypothetical protein SAMN04515674_113127 [Pseudarcicella hirudinis]|uniref:Uncharacterized protein n=1 Tax=Pseudarcicella hirudinis TaxID=1079859 RepID=A0A1I5X4K4_9BACT|nr:hypothetical protein [Pseudarcicella hirudinis]SFQ26801.1 hypothetical protein SAMN04515674_113127 [Pseudarcicella hirudinis]